LQNIAKLGLSSIGRLYKKDIAIKIEALRVQASACLFPFNNVNVEL